MGDVLSHGTSYRKKRHREARYAFGRFTRTQLPRHRERPGRLAGALLCRPFPLILLGILAREAWAAWGAHQALQPDHQPSRCGHAGGVPHSSAILRAGGRSGDDGRSGCAHGPYSARIAGADHGANRALVAVARTDRRAGIVLVAAVAVAVCALTIAWAASDLANAFARYWWPW